MCGNKIIQINLYHKLISERKVSLDTSFVSGLFRCRFFESKTFEAHRVVRMADNSEFGSIFKDLLIDLKENFDEDFTKQKLYKNVARLERKTKKIDRKINDKFNFKVSSSFTIRTH